MKTIKVDGLLVLAPSGETFGVPGWATAPTLREALFTVAMVEKGHYNISHQPTKRAMPCSYGKLADALTVCAGLCELLAEDELPLVLLHALVDLGADALAGSV